ncbi:MAG TPA: hypothetical protein VFY43_08775 [Candidatus Limnocylindria bacterium]|nr:hypothetical protein [Candidatus Limnocylindria bacterium]
MSEHTIAIAPIPLARAPGRMLVAPLLLLVAGAAAVTAGVTVAGLIGTGLVAAGLVVASLSLYLAVMLVTVRLDVEVATLRLRWFGGERRYTLVRGPVTRVTLRGDEAARLRAGFGALGWAVGRARLRGRETIDIVRLAPTASMILVPTDRGRLGIAPRSEEHLLSALSAAARIQHRLDEVAERARAFMDLPAAGGVAAAAPSPEPAAASPAGRRMLTGIERQLLEERLAAERAAALERAEAERRAALTAAEAAALAAPVITEDAGAPTGSVVRERRRATWRRPAWLARRRSAPEAADVAPAAAMTAAAATMPADTPLPAPEPEPIVPAAPWMPNLPEPAAAVAEPVTAEVAAPAERPGMARLKVRDGQWLAFGLALTPVIGAGAVWLIASMRGDLGLSVEELRPIALALLAIGPVGALAALAARAWYPRLQGLVTITALTGLVLVGRVLLG